MDRKNMIFTILLKLTSLKTLLSIGTVYILTDVLYDYGLLQLPSPIGDLLYYGRYSCVLLWFIFKFCRKNFHRFPILRTSIPSCESGEQHDRGEPLDKSGGDVKMMICKRKTNAVKIRRNEHCRDEAKGRWPEKEGKVIGR